MTNQLQDLFDALEDATRSVHINMAHGITAHAISQERMDKLKALAQLLNGSPYKMNGGRRQRDQEAQELYVVVNTTAGPGHPWYSKCQDELFVLPGEDPHTYGSIKDAAHCVQNTIYDEPKHTPETLRVYRLVPVHVDDVQDALNEIHAEEEAEELASPTVYVHGVGGRKRGHHHTVAHLVMPDSDTTLCGSEVAGSHWWTASDFVYWQFLDVASKQEPPTGKPKSGEDVYCRRCEQLFRKKEAEKLAREAEKKIQAMIVANRYDLQVGGLYRNEGRGYAEIKEICLGWHSCDEILVVRYKETWDGGKIWARDSRPANYFADHYTRVVLEDGETHLQAIARLEKEFEELVGQTVVDEKEFVRDACLAWNNNLCNEPCADCGKRTEPVLGMEFFQAGTYRGICRACAKKYHPTVYWTKQMYNAITYGETRDGLSLSEVMEQLTKALEDDQKVIEEII